MRTAMKRPHHIYLQQLILAPLPVSPPSATRALYIRHSLGMESTLRSLLLFLRKFISFFHQRWAQSARRLRYVSAVVRSRISSRRPKGRSGIQPSIERRPPKPSTTVICASQLPPSSHNTTHGTGRAPPRLTPAPGGDTPTTSPIPISIQIRHPTIPTDAVHETHENHNHELLGVGGYFLADSGPILRAPDFPTYHDEPESIHVVLPPHGEDHAPSDVVITNLPASRPLSQYSHRPDLRYSAPRPPGCSSPTSFVSIRPPSVAGSTTSRVYRASRPTTRVPRPSPMRGGSRRWARSSTPVSARQSMPHVPSDLLRSEPQATESIRHGHPSTAVSFGPALPVPQKDRLRPMIGIDRYEKQKAVVIEDEVHRHVSPPVTTRFGR